MLGPNAKENLMAIVKYGGGVAQMSGALAGNVYARNSTSNYVRILTKPINPNTDRQVAVRASLAFLTDRWATDLTQAQRDAWDLYASNVSVKNRLGDDIYISGFNHYLRSNVILKVQAATVVDDGPTNFTLPEEDPVFAITASEATQVITAAYDDTLAWCDEDAAHMWIFQGQPQNAQRNFFAGPWRFALDVAGDGTTPPTSPAAVAAVFAIAENQRQWCYARIQRADGRLSNRFRHSVLVAS